MRDKLFIEPSLGDLVVFAGVDDQETVWSKTYLWLGEDGLFLNSPYKSWSYIDPAGNILRTTITAGFRTVSSIKNAIG